MEQARRYRRLGVFVVVTMTIVAGVLIALGGRKLFQPRFVFETYFDGSVNGLDVGSQVRYRGVPLGEVTEIVMSAAEYEVNTPIDKRRNYIVVRAKVSVSAAEARELGRDASQLIRLGLRAQMQPEGITGQQYLALELMDPRKYPSLPFPWSPRFAYLPSAPGGTSEIITNVQHFLASLNEADVRSLGENLNRLVLTLNDKANQLRIGTIASEMLNVLKTANATIASVNRATASPGVKQSIDNVAAITTRLRELAGRGDLDRTIDQLEETIARLDGMVGDNQYDLRVTVEELRTTAENLRTLSTSLKRNPAGALIGRPPEKVQLPQRTQ